MLRQELEKQMALLTIALRLELTTVQLDKFIDFICLINDYERICISKLVIDEFLAKGSSCGLRVI